MSAYYNEIDPYAAQWLRNLIAAGHIAPGDVDERSIADVRPDDLAGYTQCHFFAGIGVWSHSLRLAGWSDDRPVWTGSCPCQPFSAAGKGEGTDDARHLWPEWFRLIGQCRPVAIFGEQVSAAIRHGWLDLVSADLEGAGYAVGSAVLGAHSVGAPHIRQRLYFMADADSPRRGAGRSSEAGDGRCSARVEPSGLRLVGKLAHADGRDASAEGPQRGGGQQPQDGGAGGPLEYATGEQVGLPGRPRQPRGADSDMGNAEGRGCGEFRDAPQPRRGGHADGSEQSGGWVLVDAERERGRSGQSGGRDAGDARLPGEAGFWSACDWLPCIDGKARPVEPGTFPLAHGIAGRVGRLRAYGNAINAEAAAAFIRACR